MRHVHIAGWVVVAAAAVWGPALAEAGGDSVWVVSAAEGAAEVRHGAAEPALADAGSDVASGDRVFLGFGARLSVIAVDGDARGRAVTLRGPAEGTLAELVAAAGAGGSASSDAIGALREASTDQLGAAEISRAAAGGPLRPVYPQGQVSLPLGEFAFVPEVDDLGGGTFELRLFDGDPSKGAKPTARCACAGPLADVAGGLPALVPGRRYWWQVVVRTSDGEDAVAGEPVAFTPVKAPAGTDLPPRGLETPDQRASWHLLRAKTFVRAGLLLDAYREYLELNAAGGGGPAVEKECRNLEKKLGLDAAGAGVLADSAGRSDAAADELVMTDGRKFVGRVVSADAAVVVFQMTGTRYRIEAAEVKDLRRGTGTVLPSAAPFVTVTSKRYIVSTNAGREFGKAAARDLDALFDVFSKVFADDLGAHNAKNLKARIFRDETDFAAFVAKEHPAQAAGQGFYFTGDSTLYLFRSFAGGKETTRQTLFHEGAHQLLYMRCNQSPTTAASGHYWITESLPCYLEGLELRGSSFAIEQPPAERVTSFLRQKAAAGLLPVRDFVALTQMGYNTSDRYDQGTALFWFFMRRRDGKDAGRFLGFVKDVISGRAIVDSDRKQLGAPFPEAAEGYEQWFAETFGSGTKPR